MFFKERTIRICDFNFDFILIPSETGGSLCLGSASLSFQELSALRPDPGSWTV